MGTDLPWEESPCCTYNTEKKTNPTYARKTPIVPKEGGASHQCSPQPKSPQRKEGRRVGRLCLTAPGATLRTSFCWLGEGWLWGGGGVQFATVKASWLGFGEPGSPEPGLPAGSCLRRLAACVPLPGSSVHVSRRSGLRDHCPPSTPRRLGKWGVGQGRAEDFAGLAAPQLFPLMAAMMPLTLCAPGGLAPAGGSAARPAGRRGCRLGLRRPFRIAEAFGAVPSALSPIDRTGSCLGCALRRTTQLQGCGFALLGGGGARARTLEEELGARCRAGRDDTGWERLLRGDEHSRSRETSLNQLGAALTGVVTWSHLPQPPPSAPAAAPHPEKPAGRHPAPGAGDAQRPSPPSHVLREYSGKKSPPY